MDEFSENPYAAPLMLVEECPPAPAISLLRGCCQAMALVVSATIIAWTSLRCAEAVAEVLFLPRGSFSVAGRNIGDREQLLLYVDMLVAVTFALLAIAAHLWEGRPNDTAPTRSP